ncbi:hypothetical protein [Parvularcula marina]|uniref:Uncharacterized protein n=1 Tax=Parvularcula marina TaxID=2292771 RepID=A0A371RHM8_9PROT|nr:hypothetical protein [Parvularcula marina]RFB04951.1 hypothetical protein DX908_06410 [Parvularcula marina]
MFLKSVLTSVITVSSIYGVATAGEYAVRDLGQITSRDECMEAADFMMGQALRNWHWNIDDTEKSKGGSTVFFYGVRKDINSGSSRDYQIDVSVYCPFYDGKFYGQLIVHHSRDGENPLRTADKLEYFFREGIKTIHYMKANGH